MTADCTSRRQFLTAAQRVAQAGVAGSAAARGLAQTTGTGTPARTDSPRRREVWVATMTSAGLTARSPREMCEKMLSRVDEVSPLQPDLICTPEVFPFTGLTGAQPRRLPEWAEERSGPVLDLFSDLAHRKRCYVICSTYTKEAGRCYIAAVLFDRAGKYVGEYRKINPTDSEMELGVTPGPFQQPVFHTDFGTIGILICYDVNWFDNWRWLSDSGAELIVWPSAFPGGMMLNSLAWMNKYHIVSSTQIHPTKIVDPLGADVAVTGRGAHWLCRPLNLDSAVVQTIVQIDKFRQLQKKYGRRFRIRVLHDEALALIEGVTGSIEGVTGSISVQQALQEFEIPTAREMLAASARLQSQRRPPRT